MRWTAEKRKAHGAKIRAHHARKRQAKAAADAAAMVRQANLDAKTELAEMMRPKGKPADLRSENEKRFMALVVQVGLDRADELMKELREIAKLDAQA